MKLNNKQKEAIEHTEGPLLIIAGAGSGKTTVLAHKVANLLLKGVRPENILCVTFMNKAVGELKKRIIVNSGDEGDGVNVSTFHEVGRNVLEAFSTENFSVTHTVESKQIIKNIIDEMNISKSDFLTPSNIAKIISLMKSELITADFLINKETLKTYIDKKQLKGILEEKIKTKENLSNFIHIYSKYEQQLRSIQKIDVDDMLLLAVKKLAEDPKSLEYFQDLYKYIMIDEYQDTNRSQYILSKLLAKKHQNITAVGDDFQSIYRFRGSDIRNILQFGEDYPSYKEIKLEMNYRSTKTILNAANEIISKNTEQKEKELYTEHGEGNKIKFHMAKTSMDEAEFVSGEIDRLIELGYEYRDIAIFYRSNAESVYFETVLPKNNIPFMITKNSSFFERKEIKDILSYLTFLIEPSNTFAFSSSVNYPKRGIGKATVDKVISLSGGGNIFSCIQNSSVLNVNKRATEGIKEYTSLIKDLKRAEKEMSISELIKYTIKMSKYEITFEGLDTHLRNEKNDYLNRLISIAIEMEQENKGIDLKQFLFEISKRDIVIDYSEAEEFNKVNLLTIHSAKGLEFPIVFITGMKESGFPSKFAVSNSDFEEERRLCYVAFTRAKKELYVSYPETSIVSRENDTKEKVEVINKMSRFLDEFDQSLIKTL
jgi:DNA helicase II / ATP-dependent DNA helicase PcrA